MPLLSSISGLLHSLQLNKYSQVIKGHHGYRPPPAPISAAMTVSVYSVRSLLGKCEKILAPFQKDENGVPWVG